MIDDRELWACADELMRQHGDVDWLFASQRADRLLAIGDLDGHQTFMRILARIRQLETMVLARRFH